MNLDVLASLRNHVESKCGEWGMVYLDNARPKGMSAHVFRSALSKLSAQGLYRVVDGYAFGEVKLSENTEEL